MALTNFPNGITSMGVPVGGGNFGWKTAGDVWFVDGNNGSDGNSGKDPDNAFATVGKAVGTTTLQSGQANAYDVVYVLDKGLSGTDPNPYQEADENLNVVYAKNNLAIVGVPHNIHQTYGIQIKGDATALTTAVLTVHAPFCAIENLDFNRGGSTGGGVYFVDDGDTTDQAQGSSVYNCHFRNLRGSGDATTQGGGVVINGGWFYNIAESNFFECRAGIWVKSNSSSTVKGVRIKGCDFMGAASAIDCDIYMTGTITSTLIDDVLFGHEVPSQGTIADYVRLLGDGIMSNCNFATTTLTIGAAGADGFVPTTFLMVNCAHENALFSRT